MNTLKIYGPGILICIGIAAVATLLAGVTIGSFSLEVIGAPVFAILTGMIITLCKPSFATNATFQKGIQFTGKKILQWAVVILGFSLNLGMIVSVGTKSLPVIVSTISISLITAAILKKVLKMDRKVSCLIGVGSSICGGSAIAATSPVIDADEEQVAQAISVIFLFNVLAALIFPIFGHSIGLTSDGFAVFAGTAVNDTSSVTACASTAESIYGVEGILSQAVTVKLTRTLAIIPITLVLAIYRTRKAKKGGDTGGTYSIKQIFPFFILYFIGTAILTTLISNMDENAFTTFYMSTFIPCMKWLAKFFIAMAMCAIGFHTNLITLIKNGAKPILMGFTCWVAITLVSIGMQIATGIF